jgi:hypothetical protein
MIIRKSAGENHKARTWLGLVDGRAGGHDAACALAREDLQRRAGAHAQRERADGGGTLGGQKH